MKRLHDRKRKLLGIAETCREKFVKSLWVNLFSADFGHLEPLCAAACTLAAWPLDQPTRLPVGPNGARRKNHLRSQH